MPLEMVTEHSDPVPKPKGCQLVPDAVGNLLMVSTRVSGCQPSVPAPPFGSKSYDLQSLPGHPAAGPGPLKIIAAQPTGYIDRFANRVKSAHVPRLHGLRG